jgi:putative salt-induced outer membrane protein
MRVAVQKSAKRLQCAELPPAFQGAAVSESASKLDALQTLRAIRQRDSFLNEPQMPPTNNERTTHTHKNMLKNTKVSVVKHAPTAVIALGILIVLVAGEFMARAADPAPTTNHWESVAAAGVTLTRGNSRDFLATVGVTSTKKWTSNELLLGANGGYGENTTTVSGTNVTSKTQDYLKGSAQWNYLFSQQLYGGLRLYGEHDAIAQVNYRLTVSPLAGYYFFKRTNTFLSAEVGPSYVYQQLDGRATQGYFGGRVGERGEYKFKSGAKLWENAEWIPQVDNFENWILNAEAGIAAPINKTLDVRLVMQDNYNHQPAQGREKNDFKLIAGIGVKF